MRFGLAPPVVLLDGHVSRSREKRPGDLQVTVGSRYVEHLPPLHGQGAVELGGDATLEPEKPSHLRVDVPIGPGGDGLNLHRFASRHRPAHVHAVAPHIHQRAAAQLGKPANVARLGELEGERRIDRP